MIKITNLTKRAVDTNFIVKTVQHVLIGEKAGTWDISICLTNCAKMKEFNRRFRKKNKPTDVLSFAGLEIKGNKKKLGQVIICPTEVKANAKKFSRSFQEELKLVLVHSVLHLLGYEHEKTEKQAQKMRVRELAYL